MRSSSSSLVLVPFIIVTLSKTSVSQICYYDVNKPLTGSSEAFNCSTIDYGFAAPCCFPGHVCLEQNACFDMTSKVTYQLGCTDPEYKHSSCAPKCGFNSSLSPWVGLLRDGCNAENTTWACEHPESCGDACPTDEAIPWRAPPFALPPAVCSDLNVTSTGATGQTQLTAFRTLPVTADWLITTTSTASDGSAETSPSTPSSDTSDSGLSTGAKLGIGLGVGLGGTALVIALIVAFLYWRRRRQDNKRLKATNATQSKPSSSNEMVEMYGAKRSSALGAPNPEELPGPPPLTELHGDSTTELPSPLPPVEMPAEMPAERWSHDESVRVSGIDFPDEKGRQAFQ